MPEPDGRIGPYAHSPLRTITGTQINPEAAYWYEHRELVCTPTSPVRTCAHPDLDLWLENVAGFDPRMHMRQPPAAEWPLPLLVPRVKVHRHFPPFDLPVGWYAIDYQDINASLHHLPQREWLSGLRDMFPAGSKLILDFIGKHEFIEPLWRFGREFWEHPFLDSFDAVIVPEFSSFLDDPKPTYLIGERMKQIFAEEGHSAGRLVVPSLAWASESSLRRQADLIGSLAPDMINTVFLDMLALNVDRTAWLWSRFDMLYKYFAPLDCRFLISGATAGWAVAELHEIFPRGNFHLLHIGPYMQATRIEANRFERAEVFRKECQRLEEWAAGEHLPARMPRPDVPTDLLPR